ncbi:MAG: cupin domain-containing protein [Caldilinea sp.]|nr:cupin domain-containing protein [Caldilinea sp.]MCB0148770.1 cupin domain-containing protein [Caldilineaceae bacterium]MCB9118051.1 cupin domain-containing protein [Caldilineaceae bacterium]MCB9122870.1 cupin domain-containing protein [Caldilineaceae bacterium]MCO5211402.1 cupin domain-containing protein [Caldilinea sp.]
MSGETSSPGESRLIIRRSGADTSGALLEMEARYPPHSPQPPAHYHPYQEEHFQVLSGTFRTRIGGAERTYAAGESFTVPANTPHWMHNVGDGEGRLLWQVRPALRTQAFLETMWSLAADGKTNTGGVPNLLHLAVILREYRDEFRAASPPYAAQRILFGILAPIGRLAGYRPRYDRTGKETS